MSCDSVGNMTRKFVCSLCGKKKKGTGDKTATCKTCSGTAELISEDCDAGSSGSGSLSERYRCGKCGEEWKVVVHRWSAND